MPLWRGEAGAWKKVMIKTGTSCPKKCSIKNGSKSLQNMICRLQEKSQIWLLLYLRRRRRRRRWQLTKYFLRDVFKAFLLHSFIQYEMYRNSKFTNLVHQLSSKIDFGQEQLRKMAWNIPKSYRVCKLKTRNL